MALLMFDLIGGVKVSPIEYGLVGAGLVLFFVMLLAFAEVVGFSLAYCIAGGAIIALLTAYSSAVLRSWRRGGLIAGLLTALYGVLYVLLSLEDLSLLIGSLLLFAALAAVMYLTRGLDWGGREAVDRSVTSGGRCRGPTPAPPPCTSDRETAVDVDHRAGDERRFVARKEGGQRGDFIGGAIAAERNQRHQDFRKIPVGRVEIGVDRSRLHDVDQNVALGQILCPAARKALHRRLGRAIGRCTREGRGVAVDAADDDDAATVGHVRQRRDRTRMHALDIERELAAQIVGRVLLYGHEDAEPGIVDDDIDPAELFGSAVERRLLCRGVGPVGLNRIALAPRRRNRRDGLVSGVVIAGKSDDDVGAICCQPPRDRRADAARSAGDDRASCLRVCCSWVLILRAARRAAGLRR